MIKITLDKGKGLTDALNLKGLDALVKELALQIRSRMVQATPVDSGTAKRSWTPVSRESGGPVERRSVGYSFGNIQPYSHVLDTGSLPGKRPWPGVGPRTVMEAGRIYSKQAPGGIFTNANIENIVEQTLPGLIKKYLGK